MARVRYDIMVYARRGSQPCYKYLAHAGVRPGKADRLVEDTAVDIGKHESRNKTYFPSIVYGPRGAVVRIAHCKFVVRKVRV